MKSKGTAIARVLWVQDEIHCYVHQSSFAAGPSKGYYIANTEERDNYLSTCLHSVGLWSVLQRIKFTALSHCVDCKLTLLLSMVAHCYLKSSPDTGWYTFLYHALQIQSNILTGALKNMRILYFFRILEPAKLLGCYHSDFSTKNIYSTIERQKTHNTTGSYVLI